MSNEPIKVMEEKKETFVAKHFGVSRPRLVDLRKEAQEVVHWYRKEGQHGRPGAVCWTDEGISWLEAKLGSKGQEEASSENAALFGRVIMKPVNNKLLLCEVRGQNQKVLVRDSKMFKVGMFVPLKTLTGGVLTVEKYPKRFGEY